MINMRDRLKIKPAPLTPAAIKRVLPGNIFLFSPVSIEDKRKKLSRFLNRVNSDQRIMTARILRERKEEEEKKPDTSDSFKKRYDPNRLTFSHKLIGKVQLPRTVFNILPQNSELAIFRKPVIKPLESPIALRPPKEKPGRLDKSNPIRRKELMRKSLVSFKHYKNLKLFNYTPQKVIEILPGRPYGQRNSKDFFDACRTGNLEKVQKLIKANKWLALTFDSSGETGIHWAVKRKNLELAKILIKAGAWVDSSDYVKIM